MLSILSITFHLQCVKSCQNPMTFFLRKLCEHHHATTMRLIFDHQIQADASKKKLHQQKRASKQGVLPINTAI